MIGYRSQRPGVARRMGAFNHRNFRLFWGGQLISLIGTWMQGVAQGWLVLQLTGDPLALGLVAAAQFTPVLLFGLFAGVLADALPKRPLLLLAQFGSMTLALVLGTLVLTGAVQVWHVFVLAISLGLVSAVEMPVRQAFVIELVGRDDVANAVALNSAVFNGTRIVGPAIAGILIGTVGLAACFLINGLSYVAVIGALLLLRGEELVSPPLSGLTRNARSVLDQLSEGLRFVRDEPTVRLALVVLGVIATVALNFQVLLPVLARDVLNGDAGTFGFLMAASGIGSLAASLHIAFGLAPTLRLLLTGGAAIGVAIILLAFSRSLPLSMLLMLVSGWGVISIAATANTIIQLSAPDALRGRVMSVYTTVFAGSVPLGGLFAGSIAATYGAPVALAVGGGIALATVAVAAYRCQVEALFGRVAGRPRAEAPTAARSSRENAEIGLR